MYILLKEGKLKQIMLKAIKKAETWKNLSNEIKIPRSKIWSYQAKNIALRKERLEKILIFINQELKKEDIEKELPDNWRQIIGGKNCFKKKKANGTLNKQLEESRKQITEGKRMADWHKKMKKDNPEAYYLLQYEHFKKIGDYKLTTKNGEKVRNILEKEVADILNKLGIPYQYEPLIKSNNKYFFPDFLIKNNIIIECTMWRGYEKAFKLKEKIKHLEKNYRIYVVISQKIKKYYSSIEENIIPDIERFESLVKTFIQ